METDVIESKDLKTVSKACECDFCIMSRRYRKIINKLEDPEDRQFMEEFMGHYCDVETDATYWKLKYEGNLPYPGANNESTA